MKIKKLVAVPMGLAGVSIGMGLVGQSLQSSSLTAAGQTTSSFIGPAVSISMGGYLVNQLRGLKGRIK